MMSRSSSSPPVGGAVPAVFEPPPGNPRFPLFDGLRAAAAIGVLVGHAASVSGIAATTLYGHALGDLQMGVTVFFVISGFLLYRPLVSSDMAGRAHAGVMTFYRRRALRIFPGYWFALIAISLLPGVLSVFGDGGWRYFLLIQNYSGLEFMTARGIGPAWSLSVEVAFYAVLPAFAFTMRRATRHRASPRRRLVADLVVLGLLAAASSTARALLVDQIVQSGGLTNPLYFTLIFTLPFYFTWFAVGMGFASLSAYAAETGQTYRWLASAGRAPGAVWMLAAASFVLLVAVAPPLTSGEFTSHHLLTAVVAGALVFPAAFPTQDGRGLPAKLLSLRWVVWLGLISYGIYLWSDPIKLALVDAGALNGSLPFLRIVVPAFCLSVVAGAFSYYVVERPFLRLKYRPGAGRRSGDDG